MNDVKETFDTNQLVETIMNKNNENFPAEALPLIKETLLKMLEEDLSLKDVLGFTEDTLEMLYRNGYSLYQNGKYKEALDTFNLLRELDGWDPRFTFSIAATHHKAKNYSEAAGNYMLYEVIDPQNPLPFYHLYDCFTKMGHTDLAMNALKIAHNLAGADLQYAELQGKIELELQHLEAKI